MSLKLTIKSFAFLFNSSAAFFMELYLSSTFLYPQKAPLTFTLMIARIFELSGESELQFLSDTIPHYFNFICQFLFSQLPAKA